MMNKLSRSIKNESIKKVTENGAIAYSELSNPVLTLFGQIGGMRGRKEDEIRAMFREAYAYDSTLALKMVFYAGDIREGLGERRIFNILINELAKIDPETMNQNIKYIGEFNRFDALYSLIGTDSEDAMWLYMKEQFDRDRIAWRASQPCSLLAKWLKSVNASSAETRRLGKLTAKKLDLTEKQYRQFVSKLREWLKVTEVNMSHKKWSSINYEAVPSQAMKNYKEAFKRNDSERFADYLNKVSTGEKKINAGAVYPYDIVYKYMYDEKVRGVDKVLEAQWKALPDYLNGSKDNVLCMVDISGSMIGQPIASSIGLGLYFAERNKGAFHNQYMTFSSNPSFIQIKETDSVAIKVRKAQRAGMGFSTNLEKAFELLLKTCIDNSVPQEDLPKALIVISDSEIDKFAMGGSRLDFLKIMRIRFAECGYTLPQLVFLQVAARQSTFLTLDENTLFISGNSASAFKFVIANLGHSAWELCKNTLDCPRYRVIKPYVGF